MTKKRPKSKSKGEGVREQVISSEGKQKKMTDKAEGGTTQSSTMKNRDGKKLQEDIITQVLHDYHAKIIVEVKTPVKPRMWPFYRLRRFLGLAHVYLHDAVLDGNIELVKTTLTRYIRKYPKRIDDKDEEGRTALALALMGEREDITDLILSVDQTDVNHTDTTTGVTLLHIAVLLNLVSSTQKLAFRGSDVNATDKDGMTPLMLGCRLGHAPVVQMLIEGFGAELDLEDKAGWTCLFYATYHNEFNIIQFLLERGADQSHEDKLGMKAIDWGDSMGVEEACSLLSR